MSEHAEDLATLALARLTKVLGPDAGRRVFDETLTAAGLSSLATADDLYAFAGALSARGGFEGALGGLLAVAAVMRGAEGTRS
jgi:hypothetical protein